MIRYAPGVPWAKVSTPLHTCYVVLQASESLQPMYAVPPVLTSVRPMTGPALPFRQGSIVRAVKRLDELGQQLQRVAHVAGDAELEGKLGEGLKALRRDIMFAASLYI